MKTIAISQNRFTSVDDEDYDKLVRMGNWAFDSGYAALSFSGPKGKSKVWMHALLLIKPEGYEIDHKDRNGLNNQKHNLRLCTVSQNKANVGKRKSNTSGYIGVSFQKRNKPWYASISVNKKSVHLGAFFSAIEAARAYDKAVTEHRGEFAVLNFPNQNATT